MLRFLASTRNLELSRVGEMQSSFHSLAIGQGRSRQDLVYWRGIANHIVRHAIYKALDRTFWEFAHTLDDRRERAQKPSREMNFSGILSAQEFCRDIDHLIVR